LVATSDLKGSIMNHPFKRFVKNHWFIQYQYLHKKCN